MVWAPTDIIQSIALGVLFVGFAASWRRNGTAQKARDEEAVKVKAARDATIDAKLKTINESISSPDFGLQALSKEMGGMKNNCSKVTAGYDEKWNNLERRGKVKR